MKSVITSAKALETICDWVIYDEDKNYDFLICWDERGIYTVGIRQIGTSGDWADVTGTYSVDLETWLNNDLPLLREANEIEDEN